LICFTTHAGITVGLEPAAAIRGSDLVVPLVSDDGFDDWPTTISVLVGGRPIEAPVGWIVPRAVEEPRWTTPMRPVTVMATPDRAPRPIGSPVAVIPVPADAEGSIEILGSVWNPHWVRADSPFDSSLPVAAFLGPDADPPQDDPMDWFRWAIRADLQGARPPIAQDLSPLARRVAIAIAAEWRAGLDRVASASPGAAREIAERLVATVTDDRRPLGDRLVAAWPTDTRALAGLRAILLDPDRTPIEAARAGLAWFEARPPFIAWVLEPGGDRVVLELANPTAGEVIVLAAWTDSPQTQALVLPPRSLTRHEIPRPRLESGPPPPLEEIQLVAEGRLQRVLLGSRAIPVRPPAADFGIFGLPRTLAAMSGDFIEAPPSEASTLALLRRRDDRWEIFVEAQSPIRIADDDRVLIRFGEGQRPIAVLEVRADGRRRVEQGSDDGTLVVRTHRGDRFWRFEAVIPERWMVESIGRVHIGAVMIGIRRHGPGSFVTFAGPPPPAWRREMPVQAFALGEWGDPSKIDDAASSAP
jgi:hypothetical protein